MESPGWLSPGTDRPGHLGDSSQPSGRPRGPWGLIGEARLIKSLCCRQTGEAGAVPTGVGGGQASWDSQSEEEGTAEKQ